MFLEIGCISLVLIYIIHNQANTGNIYKEIMYNNTGNNTLKTK